MFLSLSGKTAGLSAVLGFDRLYVDSISLQGAGHTHPLTCQPVQNWRVSLQRIDSFTVHQRPGESLLQAHPDAVARAQMRFAGMPGSAMGIREHARKSLHLSWVGRIG